MTAAAPAFGVDKHAAGRNNAAVGALASIPMSGFDLHAKTQFAAFGGSGTTSFAFGASFPAPPPSTASAFGQSAVSSAAAPFGMTFAADGKLQATPAKLFVPEPCPVLSDVLTKFYTANNASKLGKVSELAIKYASDSTKLWHDLTRQYGEELVKPVKAEFETEKKRAAITSEEPPATLAAPSLAKLAHATTTKPAEIPTCRACGAIGPPAACASGRCSSAGGGACFGGGAFGTVIDAPPIIAESSLDGKAPAAAPLAPAPAMPTVPPAESPSCRRCGALGVGLPLSTDGYCASGSCLSTGGGASVGGIAVDFPSGGGGSSSASIDFPRVTLKNAIEAFYKDVEPSKIARAEMLATKHAQKPYALWDSLTVVYGRDRVQPHRDLFKSLVQGAAASGQVNVATTTAAAHVGTPATPDPAASTPPLATHSAGSSGTLPAKSVATSVFGNAPGFGAATVGSPAQQPWGHSAGSLGALPAKSTTTSVFGNAPEFGAAPVGAPAQQPWGQAAAQTTSWGNVVNVVAKEAYKSAYSSAAFDYPAASAAPQAHTPVQSFASPFAEKSVSAISTLGVSVSQTPARPPGQAPTSPDTPPHPKTPPSRPREVPVVAPFATSLGSAPGAASFSSLSKPTFSNDSFLAARVSGISGHDAEPSVFGNPQANPATTAPSLFGGVGVAASLSVPGGFTFGGVSAALGGASFVGFGTGTAPVGGGVFSTSGSSSESIDGGEGLKPALPFAVGLNTKPGKQKK